MEDTSPKLKLGRMGEGRASEVQLSHSCITVRNNRGRKNNIQCQWQG